MRTAVAREGDLSRPRACDRPPPPRTPPFARGGRESGPVRGLAWREFSPATWTRIASARETERQHFPIASGLAGRDNVGGDAILPTFDSRVEPIRCYRLPACCVESRPSYGPEPASFAWLS